MRGPRLLGGVPHIRDNATREAPFIHWIEPGEKPGQRD
jgi:hypothetical protein